MDAELDSIAAERVKLGTDAGLDEREGHARPAMRHIQGAATAARSDRYATNA
jgi:hypothetical protein